MSLQERVLNSVLRCVFEQFASSFGEYSRKAAAILQNMVKIKISLVECGSLFILMKDEFRTNGVKLKILPSSII